MGARKRPGKGSQKSGKGKRRQKRRKSDDFSGESSQEYDSQDDTMTGSHGDVYSSVSNGKAVDSAEESSYSHFRLGTLLLLVLLSSGIVVYYFCDVPALLETIQSRYLREEKATLQQESPSFSEDFLTTAPPPNIQPTEPPIHVVDHEDNLQQNTQFSDRKEENSQQNTQFSESEKQFDDREEDIKHEDKKDTTLEETDTNDDKDVDLSDAEQTLGNIDPVPEQVHETAQKQQDLTHLHPEQRVEQQNKENIEESTIKENDLNDDNFESNTKRDSKDFDVQQENVDELEPDLAPMKDNEEAVVLEQSTNEPPPDPTLTQESDESQSTALKQEDSNERESVLNQEEESEVPVLNQERESEVPVLDQERGSEVPVLNQERESEVPVFNQERESEVPVLNQERGSKVPILNQERESELPVLNQERESEVPVLNRESLAEIPVSPPLEQESIEENPDPNLERKEEIHEASVKQKSAVPIEDTSTEERSSNNIPDSSLEQDSLFPDKESINEVPMPTDSVVEIPDVHEEINKMPIPNEEKIEPEISLKQESANKLPKSPDLNQESKEPFESGVEQRTSDSVPNSSPEPERKDTDSKSRQKLDDRKEEQLPSASETENSVKDSHPEPTLKQKSGMGSRPGPIHDKDSVVKTDEAKTGYASADITNSQDNKIRGELDDAQIMLKKDRPTDALRAFDKLLARYPRSPRATVGRAEALCMKAEHEKSNALLEECIGTYRKVMELDDVPKTLMLLAGRTCAKHMQFRGWGGKAPAVLRTLITNYPEETTLWNELGIQYLMVGRNDKARDSFQEMLRLEPSHPSAMAHLGFLKKTWERDEAGAVILLQAALSTDDPSVRDGRFYFQLGDGLMRIGNVSEAREWYQKGADLGLFLSKWQRSLYNVNHLTPRPWWTAEQTGQMALIRALEENWEIIRDEGMANVDKSGSFKPEDENLRERGDWKQLMLFRQGRREVENCKRAPKTCDLIERFPEAAGCKRGQVKFSVMHPDVHVWPHCGPTNCRIRAHLGVVVPPNCCKIRVMEDYGTWQEGKVLIFDDSFEHEVWQDCDRYRMVLIVDIWHPELTAREKATLSPI